MADSIFRIRVHPGIGMARLGDSDEFFIGPEAPGDVPNPGNDPDMPDGPGPDGGTYRDSQMRLKRQAQRFRIYAYDDEGNATAEIKLHDPDVKTISWRVHARNLKAANYAFQGAYLFDPEKLRNPDIQPDLPPDERDHLIIDAGVQTLSSDYANTIPPEPLILTGDVFTGHTKGTLPGYMAFDNYTPPDRNTPVEVTYTAAENVEIGRLLLDEEGRLLFLAGPGRAECVTTPATTLGNPSEHFNPPNGPNPENPLINQFAYFNVPGWWDDTCGGEIDVTVEMQDGSIYSSRDNVEAIHDDGTRNAANGGWIVTAPPKYAPHMYHVVSIKDRVFEAFPEADPNLTKPTEFYRDIYPILSRAVNYGWVSAEAAGVTPENRNLAHGPKQAGNLLSPENIAKFADPNNEDGAKARNQIYSLMRHADGGKLINSLPPAPPPAAAPAPDSWVPDRVSRGNKMPKLWGTAGKPLQNQQLGHDFPNQYLSLTANDLWRMEQWANGDFLMGEPVLVQQLDAYDVIDQPLAMDCAAMEPTIGGGFHPGIEFPYLICYPELFEEAFRVGEQNTPGGLAAYMSCPWQGDFWSCNTAWWPVQRPEIVFSYLEGDEGSPGNRVYKEWFRGYDENGDMLSSSDGYDQMIYAWNKLGMVLPTQVGIGDMGEPIYETDNGSVVYQEFERDPVLNKPPVNDD
jgi:hypothetical protein